MKMFSPDVVETFLYWKVVVYDPKFEVKIINILEQNAKNAPVANLSAILPV